MISWEDKPYWVAADDIAYDAYRQLFSQIKQRGTNYFSQVIDRNYDSSHNSSDQICIDYTHKIVSSENMKTHDNLATCLAHGDYCEIDIVTFVPKGYKIKTLINDKTFHWDFLNVLRHEIEHMCHGCSFKQANNEFASYNRSNRNFLLESDEVPAYVHGFRICTVSRSDFKTSISKFIQDHGKNLDLPQKEIEFTVKTWYDYLNNLNYHCKIAETGDKK